MKRFIVEAIIIAIGLTLLGINIKSGIEKFSNKDRKVTVKGLAEREVMANKITWPIVCKELGDYLPTLYNNINSTNTAIIDFLKKNGISENEISINPPKVIDINSNIYSNNTRGYRYNITSVITVTSSQVTKVREIISKQGELLKQGIAIVEGDYDNRISYEYTDFSAIKPEMMKEAISNAQKTAKQFAENSESKLGKIQTASQGQFSIQDRDTNTPYIKDIRVVTTVTYSLED